MAHADFRQRIVGKPGELRCDVGPGNQLERRIGEREHVLEIAELVEQPQARFYVTQCGEAWKCGDRGMAGYQGGKALQIRLGHEVIEDIDFHLPCFKRVWPA